MIIWVKEMIFEYKNNLEIFASINFQILLFAIFINKKFPYFF